MNITLNGYFEGPDHDISWSHGDFEAYSPEAGQEVDTLLFGHCTYEMMASFWPTQQAMEFAPAIATFMNQKQKVVASHRPFDPGWSKVTVFHGDDVVEQVRRLKEAPGGMIGIFGSNTLVTSLMKEKLIDEFQILVNPVTLGAGTPLFNGLERMSVLKLVDARRFTTGTILLIYTPA